MQVFSCRFVVDKDSFGFQESGRGTSRRKRGRPRKREAIYYKEEANSEDKEEDEEEEDRESGAVKTGTSRSRGKSAAVSNGHEGVAPRRRKRPLVPPPLKICAECGLKSTSHHNNLEHWRKVRIPYFLT
jgi:hypothetical protein